MLNSMVCCFPDVAAAWLPLLLALGWLPAHASSDGGQTGESFAEELFLKPLANGQVLAKFWPSFGEPARGLTQLCTTVTTIEFFSCNVCNVEPLNWLSF